MTRKALLVISYGTARQETRKAALEAIENDLASAFPERKLYRAWTSGFMRKKLRETEDLQIFSVREAMERLYADGMTDVLCQPTHMMCGGEFAKTRAEISGWMERFSRIALGAPLLASHEDVRCLAGVLENVFSGIRKSDMLAFMGHGGENLDENPYELLARYFCSDGFDNFCVGTAEHEPGFEPVLRTAEERKPRRIYLAPLLVVAGSHALEDMTGTSPDSWKSLLQREGFDTAGIMKGIGEYEQVRKLYVDHARRAEVIQYENHN